MTKKEYKPLTIPKVTWNKKELTDTCGEIVAEPLETGFGITLGNALRRILLGGVEGAAVTSVIIKNVNNEFSSIPGVVEDTMQVILNIKEIIVKTKDGLPGKMRIQVSGEKTVTVGDIIADGHLELINKKHVIAHVAADGELDIEFFVESGRGYQAAQWPVGKALQEDSRIYLDAMFSPVRKVLYDVQKARVGEKIDYDKLLLTVHTDGSENPVDVLHYAVSVLRTQLEFFLKSAEIPFNEISVLPEEQVPQEPEEAEDAGLKGISVDLLLKSIDELELSVRAHNCLKRAGIENILDLVNVQEAESLRIKNFGRKSLDEVRESMKNLGLSFGMDIKESDVQKALNNR